MAWAENIFFESQGFVLSVAKWDFPDQGITCVLGESGSGKSTLLQCLAGLHPQNKLKLSLQDELVSDLPARSRNFGFVFQDYALFPHLTAWENMAFAAEARKVPNDMWQDHGAKLFNRLNLDRVRSIKAAVLSGGEQQRVALARALVTKPRLILLDEPFSALDEKIKGEARDLVSELSKEYNVPFILVTHDIRDVRTLSRAILILSQGRALTSGSTEKILNDPPTVEVARAISENQVLRAENKGDQVTLSGHLIKVAKTLTHDGPSCFVAKNWSFQAVKKGEGTLAGTILRSTNDGVRLQHTLRLGDGQLLKAWSHLDVEPRGDMDLKIDSSSVILFKGP